ncbi:hypothetical protein EGI22_20925 [Lacihabitans sp. LS3-19]|uniref:hypothetical protein n=1 Tax=Lacihabitans sp. LS3-19 TaxID=2487335 RepID=UPI0020CE22C4|nr:hypothetical protein [Lacihabitans sp. LS3-19]MCP9770378.1 hypothetical protein [Lacihabitans sp. LS3-19]
MSTLILEVNTEQERILEGLLKYLEVSFQKVNNKDDFWLKLSPEVKNRIEKGLEDSNKGNYFSAKTFIENLLEK